MPRFVRGERFEPGLLPCLVRTGPDRGREEHVRRRATEDEVATVLSCPRLMRHELAANDECHGDRAATRAGLDVDRSLDRIAGALDADHAGLEVDAEPLEAAQLAASETAEQCDRPERSLGVRQRGEVLVGALRGLDPVAAAADRREVEVVGRVDRELVSADRPANDDAQRIEDVRDGRGG